MDSGRRKTEPQFMLEIYGLDATAEPTYPAVYSAGEVK